MNKIIILIVAIVAIANVIYSFFGNQESISVFGFEINLWIYRLFWGVIAVLLLYDYFKKSNP